MIRRDPAAAAEPTFDLTVIGGGVYGIALCLEATRQGLRTLLVERGDFGSETSWNSLRILHGGLRYLQTADLSRFRESVAARQAWIRTFPELIEPLACVMPLYGRGLKRPSILRLALAANHLLSLNRNQGVRDDRRLGTGSVVSTSELEKRFPTLDLSTAKGGALWYDAMMPSSERILMEMLHWATAGGAVCLNYMEVTRLLKQGSRVAGVVCRDRVANREVRFATRSMVSCAGPWSRHLMATLDRDLPELFRPSLAINLLLDRQSLGDAAVALSAPGDGSRALFLCPWHGRVLAGTFHASLPDSPNGELAGIRDRSVQQFLDELNAAAPELALSRDDVLLVQAGQLPARTEGATDLASRPAMVYLGDRGGPTGLWAVSGVKFTTAPQVALHCLPDVQRYLGTAPETGGIADRPAIRQVPSWDELQTMARSTPDRAASLLAEIVRQESVQTVDDLLLRRTPWWSTTPTDLATRSETLASLLDQERIHLAGDLS